MVVGITGRDVTLPCWPRPHRHMGPPHAHRLETLPWFSCYGDTLLSTRGCSVTSRPLDQLLGRARDRDMSSDSGLYWRRVVQGCFCNLNVHVLLVMEEEAELSYNCPGS
ncbi:hypothetical protein N1851_001409 [Merluccius polli]|uniref:Uncharacterized protein n=1 Tax=Merluccius polli TaxID=89951 RepID=A0AA47ND57_MERPO|nr:hypothetical protein N1851_001409 [Merluccius polli]